MPESTINSNGEVSYVDGLVAYDSTGVEKHRYKKGLPNCSFYSDRDNGIKMYWVGGHVPDDKAIVQDTPDMIMQFYAEIPDIEKEWYFSFSSFETMVSFTSKYALVPLGASIVDKLNANSKKYRPMSIPSTNTHDFMASIKYNIETDTYIASIYITCDPQDLLVEELKAAPV